VAGNEEGIGELNGQPKSEIFVWLAFILLTFELFFGIGTVIGASVVSSFHGATDFLGVDFLVMRFRLTLFALLLPWLAFGQNVQVEFEKNADFNKLKTYTWVRGMPVSGQMMDAYIQTSIDQELKNKGWTKVLPEEAKTFITYYAAGQTDFNVTGLDDPLFASVGGVPLNNWSVWYSGASFAGAARHIRKGSLSVQLFDKGEHKLIWVATAKGTVNEKMDKRLDQLDKITTKMFVNFPPTTTK